MKVVVSLSGQAGPRNIHGEVGSNKHDGARIATYEEPVVKETKGSLKSKIKDRKKKNTDEYGGGGCDAIGKMHMRKANWLGLLERGRER